MADGFTLDTRDFDKAVVKLLSTSKRDAREVMKVQAKGVIKNLYAITPPNKGRVSRSSPTLNGKQHGVAAINRDLLGGKKRAGIFFVADGGLISKWAKQQPDGTVKLWTRKDGTIIGTETTLFKPQASAGEMKTHHRRYFRNGRMSRAGTGDKTVGRWKFIDKMVVSKSAYSAFLKMLSDEVGDSCSGWNEAAAALGYKPPAWIWNHKGSGGFVFTVTDSALVIRMTNAVPWIEKIPRMRWESKIQLALNLQTGAMENALDRFLHVGPRKCGFKTS